MGALPWPQGHGDSTTSCAFQAVLLLGPFARQRVTLCLPPLTCMVALSFQLIYLKITGMLFPTSDFRHPVVTPALVCLSQLLTKVGPHVHGRSRSASLWLLGPR